MDFYFTAYNFPLKTFELILDTKIITWIKDCEKEKTSQIENISNNPEKRKAARDQ